jgi:hypothetical protein
MENMIICECDMETLYREGEVVRSMGGNVWTPCIETQISNCPSNVSNKFLKTVIIK